MWSRSLRFGARLLAVVGSIAAQAHARCKCPSAPSQTGTHKTPRRPPPSQLAIERASICVALPADRREDVDARQKTVGFRHRVHLRRANIIASHLSGGSEASSPLPRLQLTGLRLWWHFWAPSAVAVCQVPDYRLATLVGSQALQKEGKAIEIDVAAQSESTWPACYGSAAVGLPLACTRCPWPCRAHG